MIVAFETMDNHYTPAYPEVSLYAKPATSAFTLTELGSVFFVHFCICIVASGVMFVELFIGAYKKLSSENGNSAV
ncbi:unnamed protein product [Caenorhabditis auriculariae]|uniref:Uncharacterized protein n=1 Tax=Caenorhabditis auriculariae TaxID=2777116 RepID=A0A8S1HGP9_9PELO|nr:unnamed protein product [Caenorhabditis auriculariae]